MGLRTKSRACWRRSELVQHACDLTKGSESHLPRLPPNAAFNSRFKRRLQKFVIVSASHPFTRLHLRSKVAIAFEKRRHGISDNWWIIHPCSAFRFTWDFIMTVNFFYMFIMIPHVISFYRLSKMYSSAKTLLLLTPGYVVCLIDIVFNFITGFISADGHEIFIDPILIFKHYVKRLFIIDLLSSIPYTWIYNVDLSRSSSIPFYIIILEMLPLLKLCRLPTLRIYIKEIAMMCEASRTFEQGMWITWMTVLVFHWAACFTYVFPFIYAYITKTPLSEAEGYLFTIKLKNKPDWFIYLTSLHLGAGNLCSYNFTEYKLTNLADKITRAVLLIFGMAYFLYVLVTILQLVRSSAEPELKYQAVMHATQDYIKNKKLPENLKKKLLHFYEHRFQGSLFKEKSITSTLSKNLLHEIAVYSSRILLESTPIFNNTPRNLLNSIIDALKKVIFLQDDIIYKCGTPGKCMYFVLSGTVALITCSGKEVCHVYDGGHFGEAALVQHENKRITTTIALEVCEVLRFDRRDFNRLVPLKGEFFNRLEAISNQRTKDIEDIENAP